MYILLWLVVSVLAVSVLMCSARYFGKEIVPALYAGSLVTAVFIAGKLGDVAIFGFAGAISASLIVYSMTFIISDVSSEIYGRKFTQKLVWGAALCYVIVLITTHFSVNWIPSAFYPDQEAFATIIGTTMRITVASIITFVISQSFDVWFFHKIREKTGESKLWLRNNGSTLVSQAIDTLLFYTLAFYGLLPVSALIGLIVVTYILKIGIALLDTPFVYFVVNFLKKGQKENKA